MNDRWALVDADGIVSNVIIWGGGESLWPDMTPVQLDPDERCDPGWVYNPTPMASPRFTEPSPSEE